MAFFKTRTGPDQTDQKCIGSSCYCLHSTHRTSFLSTQLTSSHLCLVYMNCELLLTLQYKASEMTGTDPVMYILVRSGTGFKEGQV